MTPRQFRKAIARLDLSQVAAANIVKVVPRTIRRYASGEGNIPDARAKLLELRLKRVANP